MFAKLMLILLSFVIPLGALHLTPEQMYSARGLLMNKALPQTQRLYVQNILYRSHEKLAVRLARNFKQLHRHKCRNIQTQDLILAGKIGLHKSSRNYNGRSGFAKYAEIYIKGELFRTMTRHISTMSDTDQGQYQVFNHDDTTRRLYTDAHYYDEMWSIINALEGPTKRIFWLKYDQEFNVIRSNHQIAELMCCSEETVRLNLGQGTNRLYVHSHNK